MHYLLFVRPYSQLPLNRTRGILSPNFYILRWYTTNCYCLSFIRPYLYLHSQNPCDFRTSRIFADISRHFCRVKRKRVKTWARFSVPLSSTK